MQTERPANIVVLVDAKGPEPGFEKEMKAHCVKVRWAPTIKAVAGLLNSAFKATVVITELALKDGNWRDLVETVRRIDPSIPVVLVSSSSTAELWWDALECGVEDILPAPLSASPLCQFLATQLTYPK